MTAIFVFCLLSVLLVVGKVLRTLIPVLQRFYLPSSVIGGLVGLLVFQCFPELIPADVAGTVGKLPGFMINVVFATLFLGVITPPLRQVVQVAFPQLCFGQILAWGQYVIGFAVVGFLLIPLFGVNAGFAICWKSVSRVGTARSAAWQRASPPTAGKMGLHWATPWLLPACCWQWCWVSSW